MTATVFFSAPVAAASFTYDVSGSWDFNAGTSNLNGRAPHPGGADYSGFLTIDDTSFAISDWNIVSNIYGRFSTFVGNYTNPGSTASGYETGATFLAPGGHRLILTLDSGSAWGDASPILASAYVENNANGLGTPNIRSSGPGTSLIEQRVAGGIGQGGSSTVDPVAPVPVPAALPLLLSGLAGLVGLGRLRRRAT